MPAHDDRGRSLRSAPVGRRLAAGLRGLTWHDVAPGVPAVRTAFRGPWRRDLAVGLSVAAISIPASLGMATLAGLPPAAGLYSTVVPLVVYALIGSSRILVIGPDSTLSSLTASTLAPIALSGSVHYSVLASALAVLTGLVLLAAAALRLGFMADFLSKPVLVGYGNGVAVVIIVSQLPRVLGITVGSRETLPRLWQVVTHLGDVSVATLVMSLSLFAAAVAMRAVSRRFPAALVVVTGAIIVTHVFGLDEHGIAVVGSVTHGLKTPKVPGVTLDEVGLLVIAAAGMALVSFGDLMGTTRLFAQRDGYEVSPGRELAGVGAANIVAGLMQGQPVSSSGSRTTAAHQSGGRSQIVGLTVAACTLLVALFATPLLTDLPTCALGVILIVAGVFMVDWRATVRLRRARNVEAVLAFLTSASVVVFGVLTGLLVSIALSVAVFVQRSVRPHDAVLGAEQDIDGWHDVDRLAAPETVPGLVVYRFDAPLYFPNAPYFRQRVRELLDAASPTVRTLLLDAEAITYVDATSLEALEQVHAELAARGITLTVARIKGETLDVFDRYGLTETIGPENFFPTVRTGVEAFRAGGH